MASVFKRKCKDSKSFTCRVVVLIKKSYPTASKSFERKQEAEDWGQETERRIKQGQFNYGQHKNQYTYEQLFARLYGDGALEHHKSIEKTRSQYEYWKSLFKDYALIHITPEPISKERQLLIEKSTAKGAHPRDN